MNVENGTIPFRNTRTWNPFVLVYLVFFNLHIYIFVKLLYLTIYLISPVTYPEKPKVPPGHHAKSMEFLLNSQKIDMLTDLATADNRDPPRENNHTTTTYKLFDTTTWACLTSKMATDTPKKQAPKQKREPDDVTWGGVSKDAAERLMEGHAVTSAQLGITESKSSPNKYVDNRQHAAAIAGMFQIPYTAKPTDTNGSLAAAPSHLEPTKHNTQKQTAACATDSTQHQTSQQEAPTEAAEQAQQADKPMTAECEASVRSQAQATCATAPSTEAVPALEASQLEPTTHNTQKQTAKAITACATDSTQHQTSQHAAPTEAAKQAKQANKPMTAECEASVRSQAQATCATAPSTEAVPALEASQLEPTTHNTQKQTAKAITACATDSTQHQTSQHAAPTEAAKQAKQADKPMTAEYEASVHSPAQATCATAPSTEAVPALEASQLETRQTQHTKANSKSNHSMCHRQHTAPDKPACSSNGSSQASQASRQTNDCRI